MKVQLIASDPKYAGLFLEYRNDEVTRRFNPLMNQSLGELERRLADACSDWSDFGAKDSFFWFAAIGEEIVGTASIQNINRMMLTAEIGYGVFSAHRGKGIASGIVSQLTNDAFRNSGLRKLVAFVHEQNLSSRRVLEKNRYTQEGLLREHYLIGGVAVNEAIYGILREDLMPAR